MAEIKVKKHKVAWGITGAGDKIEEIINIMKNLKEKSEGIATIDVFLSKAALTMLKFYRLENTIKQIFPKVMVEFDSNTPFLAGLMQSHKYDFLLIAPATSNTVAKIVNGIGDTLLTNSAIMSLKSFVPVYIMPVDFKESTISTILPNGKEMKIRVRKEEADQVRKLESMDSVYVLENPQKIQESFLNWLNTLKE
ncbi:MAG: archaeoflavoprotein AfpA [Candidatus Bathyarchaeota archaeon]|nr:archaeoflavoprotein AfpA [Candidatus Bathyarchaeota archaeon]